MTHPKSCLFIWAILGAASPALLAQADRVTARIDSSQSVVLPVRIPHFATAANDKGPLDSGTPLTGITLVLKPSTAQRTDLAQLLHAQQDSKSPNYHQWLTPDQFASRFGASSGDLAKITAWLQSQGFSLDYTARARNYITFSGTAQQIANTFHTQIHSYTVNGVTHYSNATAPSIPTSLSGLVSSVRGLNNFRLKPRVRKAQPQMLQGGQEVIAPADFATIYDVNPLYNAGITGAGQKIVIVGQSAINTSDITQFRSRSSLSTANLTQVLVPGSQDPGISPGDETESDLDIEWSGAVAKDATVVFVYSDDVWTSATYAIDQNLAPVISMSYGACEENDLVDLDGWRATVQQGNAEGITFLASSGDSAAADCDELDNTDPAIAQGGLAVDAPGSFPEVTSMGGTQFDDQAGGFFSKGAALRYIPEVAWNDTALVGQLDGGGGGASVYFTQPPWQSGAAPADGMRHEPDLSFPASNVVDPLFIYSSDGGAGATAVGGTSCAAPTMAGVVALLNQYLVSNGSVKQAGLGNINPTLYRLAQTQSSAFHDIVNGSNSVPCASGSPNCTNGTEGWPATTGYDSATGLGSVDANNLVHVWSTALATQAVVVPSVDSNPVYQNSDGSWTFTISLTEEAGLPTSLTGFTLNGTSLVGQIASLFGTAAIPANGSIKAAYTLQNLNVSNGPVNVLFAFSGVDAGGAAWSTTMSVPFTGPQPALAIRTMNNAASGQSLFAPGELVGVYGSGMGNFAQLATVTPLPEYMAGVEAWVNYGRGLSQTVSAPLMYVSANQVNVQIPYEVTAGEAQLGIGNPYNFITYNFTVSSAAPGIFSYATTGAATPIGSDAARVGDTVAIYITGEGQVSPTVTDGDVPSPRLVPAPQQAVTITVGGVPVAEPYAYLGVPAWAVGVMQIDFKIPSGVAPGPQPVVVTVGKTASLPSNINITE